MSHTFTDDDVDKRVETETGDPLGVVTMTDGETAYVDVESGALDSIKSTLGWEGDSDDEVVPIDPADVSEVTEDAIRLEAGAATGDEGGTDPVIERDESTVHEDQGTERRAIGADSSAAERTEPTAAEGEGRSGTAMEPETEEMDESGTERHPDSEDQPPQGDRTVTKERGEEEDR